MSSLKNLSDNKTLKLSILRLDKKEKTRFTGQRGKSQFTLTVAFISGIFLTIKR